jgi:hypothetical protein
MGISLEPATGASNFPSGHLVGYDMICYEINIQLRAVRHRSGIPECHA